MLGYVYGPQGLALGNSPIALQEKTTIFLNHSTTVVNMLLAELLAPGANSTAIVEQIGANLEEVRGIQLPTTATIPPSPYLVSTHDLIVKIAAPLGTICGQLVFGYLADRWGRRRMYGVEVCSSYSRRFMVVTPEARDHHFCLSRAGFVDPRTNTRQLFYKRYWGSLFLAFRRKPWCGCEGCSTHNLPEDGNRHRVR